MPWEIPLNSDAPTEPLSEEQVHAVHDGAMRVLDFQPLAFDRRRVLVFDPRELTRGPASISACVYWSSFLNDSNSYVAHRFPAVAPSKRLSLARHSGLMRCNTSSIGGLQPGGLHAYGTAKAAVIAHTRSMAQLLAPRRSRVNAVAPGMIHTTLWKQVAPTHEEFVAMIGDSIPFGVEQTPEEIADAIVFLCSNRARQITGQVLAVDGGQSNRPS